MQKGETDVSILDNGALPTVLMFACFRIGAIHVGINAALKGEFHRHQIKAATASIVFTEKDYARRVLASEEKLTPVTHLFHRGNPPARSPAIVKVAPVDAAFSDDDSTRINVDVLPSDLCLLVYTDGTAGPSKGVKQPGSGRGQAQQKFRHAHIRQQ